MNVEKIIEDMARAICEAEGDAEYEAEDREWMDHLRRQARAAFAIAMEAAADAMPSTAEDPNESAYQKGRFDGIMEYVAALRALKGGDANDQ